MRVALASIVLTSLLVLSPAGGEEEESCDLKAVEKVFYCEDHEILLPAQLVSNKTYYVCEGCEEVFERAGQCGSCEIPVTKKVSDKDVCPRCYLKPKPAEACVKVYYECPDCDHLSPSAGKCEDCDSTWEKKVSRALVEYCCSECGHYSLVPGKCPEEDCEGAGKPLVRACSEAGTFPHASPPKAD